jgi:UDPglucose 6-dehydrogenase
MRVAVLGSWHLGSVTAACLAGDGHRVKVWDDDPERVAALAGGLAPVSEPGLNALLQEGLSNGNLTVEPNLKQAVAGAELVWITQDTHVNDDDTVDLSQLDALVGRLGPLLENDTSVAVSSQVPVLTCERWWKQLNSAAQNRNTSLTGIAYLPENLRLGAALARFHHPDMIVIGSNDDRTGDRLQELTRFMKAPVVRTDLRSAELVKHAINSFLATSISFANELASVADLVGADAVTVARAMRLDERIGPKARVGPGLGFAGGTLARDVTTLIAIGRAAGKPALLAEAVLEVNHRHAEWPLHRLGAELDLANATVGILGLTYTVGTSTLRRSQSVPLVKALTERGAQVRAHDPEADLSELDESLDFIRADTPYIAAAGCDAIVLLTPWPEYLSLDWSQIARAMKGNLIIDGPNSLDQATVVKAGLAIVGPGRASQLRSAS